MIGAPHVPARRVTIVVPAKDEEAALGHLLRSLPIQTLTAMGLETELFVLDGNSRDATREIAARHGAQILVDPEPGKGSALRHARPRFTGDYVVMLDADGSYPPDAIPRLLAPLRRGTADIVMGARRIRGDAMSPLHRVGNALLSATASVLYGQACPDVCTGMWAFHREALMTLPLRCRGFELEAEMYATAARLGHRIVHLEIDYLPRLGESKLSAAHGFTIGWHLVRARFVPIARRRHHTVSTRPLDLSVEVNP